LPHKKGFDAPVLDKSSENADAIRGREQQLIDAHGGAKSAGGTSGNAIIKLTRAEFIYKHRRLRVRSVSVIS
jgi:hypothetical protein